ncbi:MAG: cytochrome c [Deltaproteobacteria bacterium]|jgi:mono/diheme cytochrome c family protein|nr:cytochrome c [Deltaproteobacteria bacterium]
MLKKALVCGAIVCFMAGYAALSSAKGAGLAKGKQLFQSKCVLCHGPQGNGQGPAAAAFNPKPADFTSKSFWKAPNIEATMAHVIANGRVQMPAFHDLSPSDIQDLIQYIKHAFEPK